MLSRENTALIVIDVQERIANVMHEKEFLIDRLQRLIRGARVLEIPILLTEQYPKGLGATVNALRNVLDEYHPIEKIAFSCCNDEKFMAALEDLKCRNLLVCGIETHVCIYQTVMQLLEQEYHIEIVTDAVSSRHLYNKELALEKLRDYGADLTSVEMALFELQEIASGDRFKKISGIIK